MAVQAKPSAAVILCESLKVGDHYQKVIAHHGNDKLPTV